MHCDDYGLSSARLQIQSFGGLAEVERVLDQTFALKDETSSRFAPADDKIPVE